VSRPEWAPHGVDLDRPNAARVYDYYLGGAHNFAVDRRMAQEALAGWPELPLIMRANRAFLRRAVRHLVAQGIDQFLDIGSGIPTAGNVHEVAQAANPAARVVYVDIDPVAVAYSVSILDGNERAAVIQADLREPERILAEARKLDLIDLDRPVAVLLAGVVHFLPDGDRPDEIVATLRDATTAGSYLVISHSTHEDQPPEMLAAQKLSARTATEITLRSRAQITGYFGDFTLVEPGLVHLPLWRPESPADVDDDPARFGAFGGVGCNGPG
jgi:hypothetical protein